MRVLLGPDSDADAEDVQQLGGKLRAELRKSTRSAPSPSTEWLATLSRSVVEPRATGVQPQGENMKQTYRVVSGLVALGVLVQAASVSFGWFEAISQVGKGLVIDGKYQGNAGHAVHGVVGMYVMPLLGLILLIVSFFVAKAVPGARKWAGIVFGLIVLQVALGMFAFGLPWLGALHGINALAVFATAGRASQLTRTGQGSGGWAARLPRQRSRKSSSETSLPV